MKVFVLGLAAASVAAVQSDNYHGKDVGYGNKYQNSEPVVKKYDNGYDSGYKKEKNGYDRKDYDDGYGYQPKKRDGYGYEKDNYDHYQPTSEPTSGYDNDQTNFNSFYDNLKICKAEYTLESCIINSASRHDCFSEQRIKQCTTQFITGFCDDLATTTTGKYDNGYVKCDSSTCADAALADSLLVYNKLLRDVNTALDVTPQFDQWSFTTIKLALASTRNHADCVIKSFFHYLSGCAKSSVLPKRDLKCLDKALSSSKCEWAQDTGDGWNLPQFLQRYGDLAFNGVVSKMKSRFGTSSNARITKAIEDLLEDVADKETQFVEVVNSDYDYVKQITSVDVCSPAIASMAIDSDAGTDVELVRFHFPTEKPTELCKAKYGETAYEDIDDDKAVNLYKKCASFFEQTKKDYKSDTGHDWKCVDEYSSPMRVNEDGDVECMSTNGHDCLWGEEGSPCQPKLETKDIKPLTCGANHYEEWGGVGYDDPEHWCYKVRNALGNQGDKCFTYSGYSIKFLETGETQDLSLTTLPDDEEGKYGCRRAAWYEPQSCNSHLTQWQLTVGCCQSYASVLEAQQEKWERKYGKRGRKHNHKYNQENTRYLLEEAPEQYSEPVSEPPAKPTKVSDKFNPFHTAYEKTIISKADTQIADGTTRLEGAIYAYNGINTLSTDDIDNIDKALYSYMEFWWVKCSKLHYEKGSHAQWCSNVLQFWTDVYNKNPEYLPPSVYLTPTGGCNLHDGDIIALQSDIGRYVARCNGCANALQADSATVHVSEVKGAGYAQWKVVTTKDGKIGLKADGGNGNFLARCDSCAAGADVEQQVFVHVGTLDGNPWAQWTCKNVGNGKIALESDIHTYLSRHHDVENWSAAEDVAIAEEKNFDDPSAQFVAKRIFDPSALKDASYFMPKHYTNSYENVEGTPESAVYGEKYGQRRACYVGASPSYSDVCDSVHVDWDINTVVPVVNAKCFPQACVLAQLAQCMDIPAPATPTGYDYVAKPAPGYNGYRPSSYQRPSTYNSYTRSMLGMETSTTSYLALSGFVAGIVVVAVAQAVVQKRGKKQDIAYRMI